MIADQPRLATAGPGRDRLGFSKLAACSRQKLPDS